VNHPSSSAEKHEQSMPYHEDRDKLVMAKPEESCNGCPSELGTISEDAATAGQ